VGGRLEDAEEEEAEAEAEAKAKAKEGVNGEGHMLRAR
jgi:hypothetical protein